MQPDTIVGKHFKKRKRTNPHRKMKGTPTHSRTHRYPPPTHPMRTHIPNPHTRLHSSLQTPPWPNEKPNENERHRHARTHARTHRYLPTHPMRTSYLSNPHFRLHSPLQNPDFRGSRRKQDIVFHASQRNQEPTHSPAQHPPPPPWPRGVLVEDGPRRVVEGDEAAPQAERVPVAGLVEHRGPAPFPMLNPAIDNYGFCWIVCGFETHFGLKMTQNGTTPHPVIFISKYFLISLSLQPCAEKTC